MKAAEWREAHNRICEEIEELRSEMVTLGIKFGFLHPDVQLCSKRLDQLLLQYYALVSISQQELQTAAALESVY
ncbi:aspartyl-phosphate phosphatase Spo0E family protein [Paenibacillus chartarius]|uniref:Aspartyl-phosphate phosphatase Spo0E family protein n=1 Tax=Paenibacillus chartarius TaxID=747481 RepID=A0ABV6DFD4_9BACL